MSHHHSILDNPEVIGTTIGTTIGAAIGIAKQSFLVLLLDLQLHQTISHIFEDIILCIPTAFIGAIVGFYGTKFIKWFHQKMFTKNTSH